MLAVIAMLGTFSYSAQRHELEATERAAMESQAREIGAALQARLGVLVAQGREDEIEGLVRGNPVDLLAVAPSNYIGSRHEVPDAGEALGAWYFDPTAGELVYRVRLGKGFVPDSAGQRQVRFRLELVPIVRDESRASVAAVFRPADVYRWR